MTLTNTTTRNDYTGNGSASNFDYTFKIFSDSELLVVVKNIGSSVETTLTLNTDYTVNDAGEESGGSIDLVDANQAWLDSSGYLSSSYTLTLKRNLELTQETDIRNQSSFYPEVIEDALDRIVMITQQHDDIISGSISLPDSVSPSDFDTSLPSDIATGGNQKLIVVNTTGDGFDLIDLTGTLGNAPQYTSDSNYEDSNNTPTGGEVYYNTTSDILRTYNAESSSWINIATHANELTGSKVLVTDSDGKIIESSAIDTSELNYLNGVTSSIQTQLDTKITASSTDTLTNKTIDADLNTITNIENSDIKSGANIALNKLASTTASRVLVSDSSGVISPSSVTSTELGYISGVTSSVQTQLDTKITASSTNTITNKIIDADSNTIINIENSDIKTGANIALDKLTSVTASRALVSDSSGVISSSSVTSTELGYVSGLTSSAQTQLNEKITASSADTLTSKTISGASNTLTNISLTASVTGVLPESNGGTNQSSFTKGDILYASATNTLSKLGIGTSSQVLAVSSSGVPEWTNATATNVTMTDWSSSLTFTPSASFGTVTENVHFYRRIGDTLKVSGSFKAGTTTAATASITLPSGISIDHTKLFNSSYTSFFKPVGRAYPGDSTTGDIFNAAVIVSYNDNNIYFSWQRGSSKLLSSTASSLLGSSCYLFYEFEIPVDGWTSST